MVYLAAPYPSGNPGISCILGICIFHHNLFRICSKIILISSCFEKSCCILKFDAVVVLSAFSHPCIPILILLSSLHILWRFSSFPLFNVCSPLIYRGWPYLEEAGLTFATALAKQASEEENNLTIYFLILLFFHLFWGCVTISISTDKVQCVAQTLERENFTHILIWVRFEMCQYYHLQLLFAFRKYGGEEEINPIILQILASILSGNYIGLPSDAQLGWLSHLRVVKWG